MVPNGATAALENVGVTLVAMRKDLTRCAPPLREIGHSVRFGSGKRRTAAWPGRRARAPARARVTGGGGSRKPGLFGLGIGPL